MEKPEDRIELSPEALARGRDILRLVEASADRQLRLVEQIDPRHSPRGLQRLEAQSARVISVLDSIEAEFPNVDEDTKQRRAMLREKLELVRTRTRERFRKHADS